MPENYPSASEVIRNLAQIYVKYEVLDTVGKFRLIQFERPYWDGYEFWLVSEKGFRWEPGDSIDNLLEYLDSDEAKAYQANAVPAEDD